MKYVKCAHTAEEFVEVKSSADVLPLLGACKEGNEGIYYLSEKFLINKLNNIAGEDIVPAATERTDTDNLIDEILGEQL